MAEILRENIHASMELAKKLLDDTAAEEDTTSSPPQQPDW